MNTYADSRLMNQRLPGAAAVLLGMAVALLAAGCGEPLEAEGLSVQEFMQRDCPTGECTDPNNTTGIYVAEGSGYCIPDYQGSKYFCPQTFVTDVFSSTVTLEGQLALAGGQWPSPPQYLSFRVTGTLGGLNVQVVRVSTNAEGGLVVTVKNGGATQVLTKDDLLPLRLFASSRDFSFQLKATAIVSEFSQGKALWKYRMEYLVPGFAWAAYCDDGEGMASFLGDRKVDGVTAEVSTNPASDRIPVTMACGTGAIVGCMSWGYRPWEANKEERERADYLYGSCLQAKRAAYFVESGDYQSYTVQGTPLSVQDNAGIMTASSPTMPGLEAIWTPKGAVCFNPADRRISAGDPMPPLPAVIPLPECDATLRDAAILGTLPGLLTDTEPLATGPGSP